MALAVWIALGVSGCAVLGSGVFAFLRGLTAWRALRRVRRKLLRAVAEVERRSGRAAHELAAAGRSAERLERSRARLEESLASARALSAAVAEVRGAVARVTGFVPTK